MKCGKFERKGFARKTESHWRILIFETTLNFSFIACDDFYILFTLIFKNCMLSDR